MGCFCLAKVIKKEVRMIIGEWIDLLKSEFAGYSRFTFQKDVLAGLTVAAVALPLALAFGVASGADAAAGLITAVIAGILIGIFSGAPYQVSGPTGAMSAVLIVLATRYGVQGIWLAGFCSAIFLILMGIFRLGKLVSIIPAPVITGFTSGIAIIIALGQIDNFLGIKTPASESMILKIGSYFQHMPEPNWYALALSLLVMATMILWPKLPFGRQIPGSLAGIILATLVATLAHWQVPTISAIPSTLLLENRLHFNQITWANIQPILVPSMSIAALGAIESLLCGAVAGNMTGVRMRNSVELVAQGIGNLVIPFFGGVPATAAIARVSVNIKSGAVTRVSTITHGIALMLAALLLGSVLQQIPMAALAGVLVMTAWRMNEWAAIKFFFSKRLKHAIIAFVITLSATVMLDLTQAILIGFVISILIFVTQISDLQVTHQPADATRLTAMGHVVEDLEKNIDVYYLSGPLFFAAARKFLEDVKKKDLSGRTVILSMRGVPLVDATGIDVLNDLLHSQLKNNGKLLLAAVQPKVETTLDRAGYLDELGKDKVFWSADHAILSLQTGKNSDSGENSVLPTRPENMTSLPTGLK
jgi:SulP family sulfate permease